MRKAKSLGFCSLLLAVIIGGCSGKQASSENTEQATEKQEKALVEKKHSIVKLEESIGKQIVAKNYRKAYKLMVDNGDMADVDASQLESAADFIVQQLQVTFSKNGGVVEYRVENIEVDDNAKTVELPATMVFENGKTKTNRIVYYNRDGKWKRAIIWS